MRVRAILNPRAGLASSRATAAIEHGPAFFGRIEIVLTKSPGTHASWRRNRGARRRNHPRGRRRRHGE